MLPSEYLPTQYLHDLSIFNGGKELPEHGPFWMLCGMTIGNLFEPEKRFLFTNPSGFLCSLYALNLLNQGIYTYFPDLLNQWSSKVIPFVDIRGCHSGHGGFTHAPNSILTFSRNPSYIPRARPIELDKDIMDYTQYFFFAYLPTIFDGQEGRSLEPSILLDYLKSDPSCLELQHVGLPQH